MWEAEIRAMASICQECQAVPTHTRCWQGCPHTRGAGGDRQAGLSSRFQTPACRPQTHPCRLRPPVWGALLKQPRELRHQTLPDEPSGSHHPLLSHRGHSHPEGPTCRDTLTQNITSQPPFFKKNSFSSQPGYCLGASLYHPAAGNSPRAPTPKGMGLMSLLTP